MPDFTGPSDPKIRVGRTDKAGRVRPVNAHRLALMTDEQKADLKAEVEASGQPYDQYQERVARLKPPSRHLPPGAIRV